MKTMKSIVAVLLALVLTLGLSPVSFAETAEAAAPVAGDIVILYTNDVHCGVDQKKDDAGIVTGIGYAGVAAYLNEMEALVGADNVTLIDAGDAVQGDAIGNPVQGFLPGRHHQPDRLRSVRAGQPRV